MVVTSSTSPPLSDDRPVEPQRDVKSISHEETFAHDLHDRDDAHRELVRLADAVAARLRAHGTGARTFTLKVRDGGFTTITRATTLSGAVDTAAAVVAATTPLLAEVDLSGGIRLLGLAASRFATPAEQLQFDDLLDPVDRTHGGTLERRQSGGRRRARPLRRVVHRAGEHDVGRPDPPGPLRHPAVGPGSLART